MFHIILCHPFVAPLTLVTLTVFLCTPLSRLIWNYNEIINEEYNVLYIYTTYIKTTKTYIMNLSLMCVWRANMQKSQRNSWDPLKFPWNEILSVKFTWHPFELLLDSNFWDFLYYSQMVIQVNTRDLKGLFDNVWDSYVCGYCLVFVMSTVWYSW